MRLNGGFSEAFVNNRARGLKQQVSIGDWLLLKRVTGAIVLRWLRSVTGTGPLICLVAGRRLESCRSGKVFLLLPCPLLLWRPELRGHSNEAAMFAVI